MEIAKKYAFLNSQPVKTPELNQSLTETRKTMAELSQTIQDDLYKMIESDVHTLKFEVDVTKKTLDRKDGKDRRM